MGLFDFWREKPITTTDGLVEEIARSAAFLVNKSMYEYARARSGVLSGALLKEKEFQDAVEIARWTAYPLAVGYVAEMIHGLLREGRGGEHRALDDAMVALAWRALEKDPAPTHVHPEGWRPAGEAMEQRLRTAFLAAPKAIRHIPDATVASYFDAFPLHATVKQHDFEPISNNLRSLLLFRYEKIKPRLKRAALDPALGA